MSPLSRPSSLLQRSLLVIVALAVVWAASARASTSLPQKGGNKTVLASAIDADGNPVTDLVKGEWGVREDGADRTIVDVKPAGEPLDIVLMVDTTKTIGPSIIELRNSLKSFAHVIQAGNQGARIAVMNVASAAVMVSDGRKMGDELDKILARTFADQTNATVFLEGLVDAAKKLQKSPTPRRAIVVVNLEGVPESSSLQPPLVIQQIVQSGASLWAVSYANEASRLLIVNPGAGAGFGADAAMAGAKQGGIGSANTGQNRDLLLKSVPPGTGGFRVSIEVPSALEQTLRKMASALLAQYEVTYTRPDGTLPKVLQMGQVRKNVKIAYPATPPK